MGSCCSTKSKNHESRDTKPKSNFVEGKDFIKLIKDQPLTKAYRIVEKLGEGGYGSVKKVRQISTGRQFACKTIKVKSQNTAGVSRLLKEVNILKALDHPNIIKIFEVYQDKTNIHIVQELCTGGDLFDSIQKNKNFSENQAAKYMLDICSVVMYCHEEGIVHRDLKPENLLLESQKPDAGIKVIDFGTSVCFTPNQKMKQIIGTCYYMAPELLRGNYDEKCDVWSCGVILYILLSGYPPFNGRSDRQIQARIMTSELEFKGKIWNSVSQEAKDLIQRMLTKNPSQRPSIKEVYNDQWIQTRGKNQCQDNVLGRPYLKNLAAFNIQSQLQRATMSYIATQLLSKDETSELERVFRALDENGDGKLSKNEIQKGLEKNEVSIPLDVESIMAQCDTDGNGFINYSEFLIAAANWYNVLSYEKLKQAFAKFDKDGDGHISLNELRETLAGGSIQDSQITAMLNEADTNGDGVIDLDEFSAMMRGKVSEESSNRV